MLSDQLLSWVQDYAWSGFISAVAIVRPQGIAGMQAASVKKKLKQQGFAAAVKREDIVRGAEDLGVPLDEHIQFVIDALQPLLAQSAAKHAGVALTASPSARPA